MKIPVIKVIMAIVISIGIISASSTNVVYAETTLDSIMSGADEFISTGEGESKVDADSLHETSNMLYNTLLGIGMIIAVAVGIVLGIKFMTASVSEKASIKEALMAYVAGCVVVFGAFIIWKLAVTILS